MVSVKHMWQQSVYGSVGLYGTLAKLQNVNFFTQIISVQLNLPQEKTRKLREVFDI